MSEAWASHEQDVGPSLALDQLPRQARQSRVGTPQRDEALRLGSRNAHLQGCDEPGLGALGEVEGREAGPQLRSCRDRALQAPGGFAHRGRELQATLDVHDRVCALFVKPETQIPARDFEVQGGARPPALLRARDDVHGLGKRRSRAPQRLREDGALQRQLRGVVELLVGTAAAALGVRARGLPPRRGRDEDSSACARAKPFSTLVTRSPQPLSGKAARNEHGLSLVPREAEAAIDRLLYLQLEHVADVQARPLSSGRTAVPRSRHRGTGSAGAGRGPRAAGGPGIPDGSGAAPAPASARGRAEARRPPPPRASRSAPPRRRARGRAAASSRRSRATPRPPKAGRPRARGGPGRPHGRPGQPPAPASLAPGP